MKLCYHCTPNILDLAQNNLDTPKIIVGNNYRVIFWFLYCC